MERQERNVKDKDSSTVKHTKQKPRILDHAPDPRGRDGQQIDPDDND